MSLHPDDADFCIARLDELEDLLETEGVGTKELIRKLIRILRGVINCTVEKLP